MVIDKPGGLTSHDVVDVARRALRMTRIGHTGTLDPMATGVLPLACGKATRLVRFLTGSRKSYRATIQFGLTTDTYDVTGTEVSRTGTVPDVLTVARVLASQVGGQLQMPPAFSAKRVAGRRAYEMARRQEVVELTPAPVTLHAAVLVSFDAASAVVDLECSAGYYVRSLAHDMGQQTGSGACLAALRRTRSGQFREEVALPLDELRRDPSVAARALVPMADLLADIPAVVLDAVGYRRVSHGQPLHAPADAQGGDARHAWVRLVDAQGQLVAMAQPAPDTGALHPVVVLI